MRKTLTYPGFAVATLAVIAVFVTAKSYAQLGLAVLLYPLLAYFAFVIFPRRVTVHTTKHEEPKVSIEPEPKKEPKTEELVIKDIDRRAFLKFIGATGLSFFLFSLLGRHAETMIFGQGLRSGAPPSEPSRSQAGTKPSPSEGYRISEIDENDSVTYYGFTNKDGAWYIVKEDTNGSFRYAKGEKEFANNWETRRDLKYDYFYNTFNE